jgi:hypothetical protein
MIDPHAAPEFGDRVAPAAPRVDMPGQQPGTDFLDRKDAASQDLTSGGSVSDLPAPNAEDPKYK